jgi:FKBP-type peptidyl-prolyl cis-trans isomerase SlyD
MQIEKNKVATIDYTLTNPQGQVLDTSKGAAPLSYLHGVGGIIPGLETALEGKSMGEQVSVTIAPEHAYGARNEQLVQEIPRQAFQGVQEIRPGMQFRAQGPNGQQTTVAVISVTDDSVKVDANHPLAGITLKFDVNIVGVRDATPDELAHGHVHGPDGGHHHH